MKFDHQNILDYSVENDVTVSRTSTVAQKVAVGQTVTSVE